MAGRTRLTCTPHSVHKNDPTGPSSVFVSCCLGGPPPHLRCSPQPPRCNTPTSSRPPPHPLHPNDWVQWTYDDGPFYPSLPPPHNLIPSNAFPSPLSPDLASLVRLLPTLVLPYLSIPLPSINDLGWDVVMTLCDNQARVAARIAGWLVPHLEALQIRAVRGGSGESVEGAVTMEDVEKAKNDWEWEERRRLRRVAGGSDPPADAVVRRREFLCVSYIKDTWDGWTGTFLLVFLQFLCANLAPMTLTLFASAVGCPPARPQERSTVERLRPQIRLRLARTRSRYPISSSPVFWLRS